MAQQTEPRASPEQSAAVTEQLSTLARVVEQLESASQQFNAQGGEQVRILELILSIRYHDLLALTLFDNLAMSQVFPTCCATDACCLTSGQVQQLEGLSADIATMSESLGGMQRRVVELASTIDAYNRTSPVASTSGGAHSIARPYIAVLAGAAALENSQLLGLGFAHYVGAASLGSQGFLTLCLLSQATAHPKPPSSKMRTDVLPKTAPTLLRKSPHGEAMPRVQRTRMAAAMAAAHWWVMHLRA